MAGRGVPRLLKLTWFFRREDEVHTSDALGSRVMIKIRVCQEFLVVQMVLLRKGGSRGGASANLD